ncbi:peptidase S8 family [Rhizoctonia solani]|uniref:Peptidase S8 family n=1 Tax=Rhizoctonia solani TaxID=456999 RepID=A0A8H7I946_9AGAM|nr:peptidase S8 family [Rhizoctonia solani]
MHLIFWLSALATVVSSLAAPGIAPLAKRDGEKTYIVPARTLNVKHRYSTINAAAIDMYPEEASLVEKCSGFGNLLVRIRRIRIARRALESTPRALLSVIVDAPECSPTIASLGALRDFRDPVESSQITPSPVHERRDPAPNQDGDTCPGPVYDENGGSGVTIYGIDTGIKVDHACFGGRAKWGKSFVLLEPMEDLHGHGTHTAGTAVGLYYGVAQKAHIVAVKVIGATGIGNNSDVIAGVDYACTEYKNGGYKPSIVTMSLGGPPSEMLDEVIKKCAQMGIQFTVAAGNDNADASNYSPARVPIANTVGAIDYSCKKASFSNFGPTVDIHSFGVNVESAWIGLTNNDTKTISGTSMATPHVAGILAVAIARHGNMDPADLTAVMKANAYKGATGFPSTPRRISPGCGKSIYQRHWHSTTRF